MYRFCQLLNNKLSDPKLKDKAIVYYSGTHGNKRTNAVYLITSWLLLYYNLSPDDAFKPFRNYSPPFIPWHDATPSHCSFLLTILDTLRGLEKARALNYFNFEHFDIAEYEHFEQVENGDLNWCLAGKFIAFAGPHQSNEVPMEGYHALPPDHYIPYFKKKNVTLVIRFNKKCYDAARFKNAGIDHADLYFVDGTNPPDHILARFLQLCEETPGAVAVHCKAGLGRTGTCIGAYMMKHHRLTAEEAIGWLRICRPGSVIGQQQHYMKEIQAKLWREGELYEARSRQKKLDAAERHLTQVDDDTSLNHTTAVRRGSGGRKAVVKASSGDSNDVIADMQAMSLGAAINRPGRIFSSAATANSETGVSGAKAGSDSTMTQGDLLRLQRARAAAARKEESSNSSNGLPVIHVATSSGHAAATAMSPPLHQNTHRERTPPVSTPPGSGGGFTGLFSSRRRLSGPSTPEAASTPTGGLSRFMSTWSK